MNPRLSLFALVVVSFFSSLSAAEEKEKASPETKSDIKSFKPIPAHDFGEADGWLNSKPLSIHDLKGRVVVIHFWTFGCINCQRNLPHYKAWQKEFKDLVIIGIHTPESEGEKVVASVQKEMKLKGITYPVVIDNSAVLWKKWQTRLWPTCGIIDKQGLLRYYWEGELNWKEQKGEEYMRGKIEELLAEKYVKK